MVEGTTIGQCRLVRPIGTGGMGVVYLAEHALIGRRAAIKVLLPELSMNRDIVSRFFNEAKAMASISDPGSVQMFDFGFHTDGCSVSIAATLNPDDERKAHIIALLIEHDGRISDVARAMGKARMQIHRWIQRYEIDIEAFRK